jgi:hypothetical protein
MPTDEEFAQLIREVLQNPDGSSQQQQAMERLLGQIPNLTGIYTHNDSVIDYLEALNRALIAVSIYQDNISNYNLHRFLQRFRLDIDNENPEVIRQNFVRWFNRILKNKIIDMYRQLPSQPLSLDTPINEQEGETNYLTQVPEQTLTGLDNLIVQEQKKTTQSIGRNLWQYIEEDPERKLQNCHPRNHPKANCQELAKRSLLKDPPDSLTGIATELNVNYQTLNSHNKRHCYPLLREIARRFGYQQEQEL